MLEEKFYFALIFCQCLNKCFFSFSLSFTYQTNIYTQDEMINHKIFNYFSCTKYLVQILCKNSESYFYMSEIGNNLNPFCLHYILFSCGKCISYHDILTYER